ncbi:MAG TPA: TIGR00296 family protein [Nitrososphaeraceae archaeon]|nr:TIGR00296 family protein [Nitrososphaeraceae archaeon]
MAFPDYGGQLLVKLARKAVERYLEDSVIIAPDDSCKVSTQKMGVFVTINQLDNKIEHLRGCIGFPLPQKELYQSIIEAAISAATKDPRFQPVTKEDLSNIIFEVSLLTIPEEIKVKSPKDYLSRVKIGRDGLIIQWKHGSGLLLPQVPVDLKWSIEQYLTNLCFKAGGPSDAWLMPDSKLYKFETLIYKESAPSGKVSRVDLPLMYEPS